MYVSVQYSQLSKRGTPWLDLNTLYVSVQFINKFHFALNGFNLNTLYVSVQSHQYGRYKIALVNLNTLYVSVQSNKAEVQVQPKRPFKYIVCFGSIAMARVKALSGAEFKYIVCFGSIINFSLRSFIEWHLNTLYVSVQSLLREVVPLGFYI